jgi:hypothetical protein
MTDLDPTVRHQDCSFAANKDPGQSQCRDPDEASIEDETACRGSVVDGVVQGRLIALNRRTLPLDDERNKP